MSEPLSLRDARTKRQKDKIYKKTRSNFRSLMKLGSELSPNDQGDEKIMKKKKFMNVDEKITTNENQGEGSSGLYNKADKESVEELVKEFGQSCSNSEMKTGDIAESDTEGKKMIDLSVIEIEDVKINQDAKFQPEDRTVENVVTGNEATENEMTGNEITGHEATGIEAAGSTGIEAAGSEIGGKESTTSECGALPTFNYKHFDGDDEDVYDERLDQDSDVPDRYEFLSEDGGDGGNLIELYGDGNNLNADDDVADEEEIRGSG